MIATVATRPDEREGACGGVYYLDARGKSSYEAGIIAELLARPNLTPPIFIDYQRDDALPLNISVVSETEGPLGFIGGCAYCNNFISFFSLGIWPWIYNKTTIRNIRLSNECINRTLIVETTNRAWSSFIVPFCLLPVPGWGEVRECSIKIENAIPFQKPSGADYKTVADYVADNLLQAEYDAAVPRMIYTRPVKSAYDPRQNVKRDLVLKQYALTYCPSEWEQIQQKRADLAIQDLQTDNLESRLKDLGHNPKDSIPYLKECEKRYWMAKDLEKAYQRLERLATGEKP